jgi:hypothetical protein
MGEAVRGGVRVDTSLPPCPLSLPSLGVELDRREPSRQVGVRATPCSAAR